MTIHGFHQNAFDNFPDGTPAVDSEERFRTLVGSIDDLVYTLDQDLRIGAVYGDLAIGTTLESFLPLR